MSSSTSWYTEQYNALRNAQIKDSSLADALHRENIGDRVWQTKAAAQRNLDAISELNKQRLVQEYADNEKQLKFGREQIERNKAEIARKYSTIEIPNGKGGYTAVPSEFSKVQGGQLAVSNSVSPTTSSQSMNTAYAPKTAMPIEADFLRSASPVEQVKQANSIPQQPMGLGKQIGATGLGIAGGIAGDYLGDRASEAVFGQSNGIGSQIGSALGSVVGGLVGASASGAATLGLGSVAGGIAGATLGSGLGSLLGSSLDALGSFLFPDKTKNKATNQVSNNSVNTANLPSPFTGGQSTNVLYYINARVSQPTHGRTSEVMNMSEVSAFGSITEARVGFDANGYISVIYKGRDSVGALYNRSFMLPSVFPNVPFVIDFFDVVRADGFADIGGNVNPINNSNVPYAPTNLLSPQTSSPDFGEVDVLENGEKYVQGTARVNSSTRKPQILPDESKRNGVRQIDPNQLNPVSTPANNNIGTSPTSDRKEGIAQPSPKSSKEINSPNPKPDGTYIYEAGGKVYRYMGIDSNGKEVRQEVDPVTGQNINSGSSDSLVDEPRIRAAKQDAKAIEKQLQGLSTVIKNGETKSPQQQQKEQYERLISNDPIRVAAFKEAQAKAVLPLAVAPVTPQPTAQPASSPDTLKILGDIALIGGTVTALKIGSDLLVNNSLSNTPKINQIAQNTTNVNQQTNAKQGVCDAMQPQQCGFEGVKQATAEATAPIKDQTTANAGLLAQVLAAIANLASTIANLASNVVGKLDGIKEFLEKVARAAKLDKIYGILTFITVVHNAQMLSNSLATTLMDSLSLGLATIGIKDENESPIDIQSIINKSVEDTVKGIVGTANYTTLSDRWKQAVRVYQAAANITYQVRSLWDSAKSLAELTGANVGKIGNALRRDGAVSENAYTAMADNPLMVNSAMTRLQNLEEAASHLNSITSEAYSVTETVTQIKKDQDDFKKLVKESQPLLSVPNDAAKAKDDAAKLVSVSPSISNIDLVKP